MLGVGHGYILPLREQMGLGATTQKYDIQALLYEDTKRRWNEEKDGKVATTTLTAVDEMIQHELNQAINYAMGGLVQLVERYDRLSLVGSCSAQVRGAVSKERRVGIGSKGVRYSIALVSKGMQEQMGCGARSSVGHTHVITQ